MHGCVYVCIIYTSEKLEKITCQRIKWANKVGKCYTAIKVIIWKTVDTWMYLRYGK